MQGKQGKRDNLGKTPKSKKIGRGKKKGKPWKKTDYLAGFRNAGQRERLRVEKRTGQNGWSETKGERIKCRTIIGEGKSIWEVKSESQGNSEEKGRAIS